VSITTLRFPILLVAVLGLIVALRLVLSPLVPIALAARGDVGARGPTTESSHRVSAESATAIVSRDPFRIARRPTLPAYDPLRLAEQLAPPPPRPALSLVGIVIGAVPSAVIEGLPGVEGSRVLRVGDVVAGLRVKQISRGRVVIAGMDTTWALEVREPWKN
jgi:hypothetical protein